MATLGVGVRQPAGARVVRRSPSVLSLRPPLASVSVSVSVSLSSTSRRVRFPPLSASLSESSISSAPSAAASEVDPTAEVRYLEEGVEAGGIVEWELDFCSRPIVDARGKKVWELAVCDPTLSLQYTRFFPNNAINSLALRDAIRDISEHLGLPLPDRIRFFRSQMKTVITRACSELGIKPVPTKRCVSLILWLEERYETVYTRHPGFQQGSKPLLALDNPFPMQLPENLYGDKWAFVQLPFSAVKKEASLLEARYGFGGSLDLDLLGIEVEDKILVPGLAVASSRAKPLAALTNGLEVCSIEVDASRACLILSVGISTRYIYATYKKNAATTREAEAWEEAKKACGGLHFLAIQETLDSDECTGFWLLLDLPPPPV